MTYDLIKINLKQLKKFDNNQLGKITMSLQQTCSNFEKGVKSIIMQQENKLRQKSTEVERHIIYIHSIQA